ncbi:MAG: RluA family pseudouridine synthase [Lachnospiraceae bacterium]|nr:RluA family pseudouridine synthase [Lachnospiraceae bacterium]
MERILNYQITATSHGLTIQEYLKKQGFSSGNITDLKKMNSSVILNGSWVYMTTPLTLGDCLQIHIKEEEGSRGIVPVSLPFPIVYEDEDLVIINKPCNMPIHPSQNNYTNTLANSALYHYQVLNNTAFTFRCINRLDKDTTGLTILAKHIYSANLLAAKMQRGEIKRFYLAAVQGSFPSYYGKVDLPIGRKPGSTIERIVDYEHGEHAITHYCKLKDYSDYSLLGLRLKTGRTHQIRVHMSHLGYPLLGDSLYSAMNGTDPINRQALHAIRLDFIHPVSQKRLRITAPLPEDMKKLFP